MEILKSLEGQPSKKWDCPSEIGTVGNYVNGQNSSSKLLPVHATSVHDGCTN